MENWHVRLDYEKALDSKKQLLSSEINLLHILKHMRNYSTLKKKEIAINAKLKASVSLLMVKLNVLRSTLPKSTAPKLESKIKRVEIKIKENQKSDFQKELDDIKEKLARLG